MAQPEAEQRDRRGSRFTVLVIGLMVLGMLALGLFAFRAIGERPRAWSYGTHPLIPAETYSSTQPAPPPSQAPKQIELPPRPVRPRPVRPQPGAKGAK
jgi:hypothetical protein